MRRLIYDVPRWHLYLHREAMGFQTANESDPAQLKLGDELFDRLYAGGGELLPAEKQDPDLKGWAEQLHTTCSQLPAFERLAQDVRGDAFASGLAVLKLLEELKASQPQQPNTPPEPQVLRRQVGRGTTQAARAVEETRESQEGLAGVHWGTGSATGGPQTSTGLRTLANRLQQDPRLKRIALLAGRLKRIAAQKQRSKVRHGADEVADVEQGADIGRLLPSELARMSQPRQRLAFLRDFTERSCLQYQLAGLETLGKGPLVVCLDKSGSMEGEKDVWATAVALALLQIAQVERRLFCLLCFNGEVTFEALVRPDERLPEAGLFVRCDGGTSIAAAIGRSLQVIGGHQSQLRKADIVLVTDGSSDAGPAPDLREAANLTGVSILGCGIDVDPDFLVPWCDETHTITDTGTVDDQTAGALFGT